MPKPETERTTLYHSDLVKRGECTIDFTSDVQESKHKKGTYYIWVSLEGRKRQYAIDNETIQAELADRNGQRCVVVAEGNKDTESVLTIKSARWTKDCEEQPAQPAKQERTQPPSSPRPPSNAQPDSARPKPANASKPANESRPASEKVSTSAMLTKNANLLMKCVLAERAIAARLLEDRQIETNAAEAQARVACLFIQMTRDNFHHQQNGDKLIRIKINHPAPEPTSKPEAEAEEPEL